MKIIPVGDFEFRMKPDDAEKVYEILVTYAGFQDTDHNRNHFIMSMREGSSEYRFRGSLGVGGRYLIEFNVVSCYAEDLNEERFNIIRATNQALRDYHELSRTKET